MSSTTDGDSDDGCAYRYTFYGGDQLGTVRRAFQSTTSAPAYGYDPYGQPLQTTAPVTDFTYAGMVYNADSSLDLTQYRIYNPTVGRWLSRDPLGKASDPAANLYRYGDGNPITYVDPRGGQCIVGAVAGALIFGGIDLAHQLAANGFNFGCVNPWEVGLAASGGALIGSGIGAILSEINEALAAEEAEDMVTLYRGVDAAHPGFANALEGTAIPRGGSASVLEHVFGGNTESEFTSWTTDFSTAEGFATRESGSDAVLSNSFPRSSLIPSPGNAAGMDEMEFLVRGPVTGSSVMRVPAW